MGKHRLSGTNKGSSLEKQLAFGIRETQNKEASLANIWSILKNKESIFLDEQHVFDNIKVKKDWYNGDFSYSKKINETTVADSILRIMKKLLQDEGINVRGNYIELLLNDLIKQNDYVNNVLSVISKVPYVENTLSEDRKYKQKLSSKIIEGNHLNQADIFQYKMSYLNHSTENVNRDISNSNLIQNSEIQNKNLESKCLETPVNSNEEIGSTDMLNPLSREDDIAKDCLEITFNHDYNLETVKVLEQKQRNGHTTIYCKRLEQTMDCCPFTGISDLSLLVHSHIKPWSMSTDEEKLDGYNGLLLEYGYDMLFDKGWITFENDGTLLISPRIPQELLNIYWLLRDGKTYNIFNDSGKRSPYLEYHRKHVYKS
ncbi:HNH endonuclease [Turicibacter sanguinis]|uniref:HNH endonuclease n=1 Tax=Turicibacter sanguinis TaxID=154288 RepID=UPI0006C055F3|nr:HNH endonuclease signature motif containing protein [Turicibacter sanguinis]CUN11764.1 Uncharacterised protein [Turicibacter sanguinis]